MIEIMLFRRRDGLYCCRVSHQGQTWYTDDFDSRWSALDEANASLDYKNLRRDLS